MSILEDKLDALIAKDEGIAPQEVTKYVQRYREEHADADEQFDFSTNTGGLNPRMQDVITRKEIDAERERAEAVLSQFHLK